MCWPVKGADAGRACGVFSQNEEARPEPGCKPDSERLTTDRAVARSRLPLAPLSFEYRSSEPALVKLSIKLVTCSSACECVCVCVNFACIHNLLKDETAVVNVMYTVSPQRGLKGHLYLYNFVLSFL